MFRILFNDGLKTMKGVQVTLAVKLEASQSFAGHELYHTLSVMHLR